MWVIKKIINTKRRRSNLPFLRIGKENEIKKMILKDKLEKLKVKEIAPEHVSEEVLLELFKHKIFLRFYKDLGKTDNMADEEYNNIKVMVLEHNEKLLKILKKTIKNK